MVKVYLVNSLYSNEILGVFSTQKKADNWIEEVVKDDDFSKEYLEVLTFDVQ